MSSRIEDPEGYDRRRAYFRNRAIVRKIDNGEPRIVTDRLTDDQLWYWIQSYVVDLETRIASGTSPEAMNDIKNVKALLGELELRGQQLQLPGFGA